MDLTPQTRPLAVVTGASTGIGRALAQEFAAHGFDLVIAADEDLGAATEELLALGSHVEPVQVDLTTDEGVDALWRVCEATGRPLDAAVLNAGVGASGDFATGIALEDDLRTVDLNVRSTVHLAKHVAAQMAARREGRILFVSSIAATMPGPYQAVYNASKSFVQSLALGLRVELAEHGVSVTSLMPGPTDTAFFARADMEDTGIAQASKDDPADVARDGFEALMRGEERVVSASLKTKLQAGASRVLPDAAKAALAKRVAAPGSGRG